MVTGLKTSLQEQAVPGGQHKMENNPPKKTNCRAEQSLVAGRMQRWQNCSGTGYSNFLSKGLRVCCRLS